MTNNNLELTLREDSDITLKKINRLQAIYSLWNSGDLAL